MADNRAVSARAQSTESRTAIRAGAGVVLAATLVTLAAGYLVKLPCITGSWEDGRQYRRLCYSDVAALYGARELDTKFPYLEADNEYPVLTGLTMAAAAVPSRTYVQFFNWTAVLLAGAALATAWALHRIAGRRALLFAVAPTLVAYGFMNWDLIAVMLATLGTLAFLRGRDVPAGVLLGLGAAAKLYPALLVIPFAVDRLRDGRRGDGLRIAATAAGTWVAMNLPFALLAPERWWEFFSFNAARPADWDSVWFLAQRHFHFAFDPKVLNVLTAISLVLVSALVWVAAAGRPRFRPWMLGFPFIVAFLLTGKVYSPQYSLWLLPWFVLVLPDLRLFVAFSITDFAVFVTRFQYFGEMDFGDGVPFWAFEVALLLRLAVLVTCVVVWLKRLGPAEREPRATVAEGVG